MCKSTEVLETVVWPQALMGSAWVMPTLAPGINGTDASGIVSSSPVSLSCEGWSNDGSNGLTVDADGSMQVRNCGVAGPAACCKPVRLPKPRK